MDVPQLEPRRISASALRAVVRAADLPVIGSGVRSLGLAFYDIEALRDAELGDTPPWIPRPPGPAEERERP